MSLSMLLMQEQHATIANNARAKNQQMIQCVGLIECLHDRSNIEQTSSKRRANIEQTSSWLKQAYWNPALWFKCRPRLRLL